MIHPTAEVSKDAIVRDGVQIWHQAQIREGVTIGKNVIIGKNSYLDAGVTVGDNCKIQNNCSLYHGATIEKNVFVGPHTVLANDLVPRATNKDGSLKKNQDWKVGEIIIKEGASLGANVVVLPGVTIGKYAMVGAGSVVTKDVPAFGLVYGNPARSQGYVCKCGIKLGEEKKAGDSCGECKE